MGQDRFSISISRAVSFSLVPNQICYDPLPRSLRYLSML